MLSMPILETDRLIIRPFVLDDLDDVHRLLDIELGDDTAARDMAALRSARERWLRWTALGYDELAGLFQPPYGDRAVTLRDSGAIVGACGLVPLLAPFGQLREMSSADKADDARAPQANSTEVGLYYAISPSVRRKGYATEAARALIDYALGDLRLHRIAAGTTYDNTASIGVMRRLGMRMFENALREPEWFQVVGMLTP